MGTRPWATDHGHRHHETMGTATWDTRPWARDFGHETIGTTRLWARLGTRPWAQALVRTTNPIHQSDPAIRSTNPIQQSDQTWCSCDFNPIKQSDFNPIHHFYHLPTSILRSVRDTVPAGPMRPDPRNASRSSDHEQCI